MNWPSGVVLLKHTIKSVCVFFFTDDETFSGLHVAIPHVMEKLGLQLL